MLDKLTAAVLAIVNEETDGSYKVVDADELLSRLPARFRADAAGLSNALSFLSARGYIDIRYSDKGTYCLCSLPKGRSYAESNASEAKQTKAKHSIAALFFGAFAGGAVGAIAAGLIAAFLLC